ncbi:uncharacterized protein [Penaeus vannamei]|uniref:uncharacterized protein isoform X2 n=1 Tax=Penaeus vannamei TaxID=6689 RepID=UPI00387FA52D
MYIHPRRTKFAKMTRKKRTRGPLCSAILGRPCPAGVRKMSGPSGGVLAVGHLAAAPAGGSKGALGEAATRGGDDPARDGGGGRAQEGGEAPRQNDAVYTSSSYAASRGLRRPSAGRTAASPPQVAHPVPPPRSKAGLSIVAGVAAPGIMKSSSEIFLSSTALPPTKGILKSSSGVLRPGTSGAPLSRSASGGVVASTARVNFSSTVSHIESSPPSSPTEPPFGMSVAALSSPPSGPSKVDLSFRQASQPAPAVATSSTSPASSCSSHACAAAAAASSRPPSPPPPPLAPPRTRPRGAKAAGKCLKVFLDQLPAAATSAEQDT